MCGFDSLVYQHNIVNVLRNEQKNMSIIKSHPVGSRVPTVRSYKRELQLLQFKTEFDDAKINFTGAMLLF
jgi:hypothetical protein